MPRIFLDCDGVLADFDKKFIELTGHDPRLYEKERGQGEFWKQIYEVPKFFETLEPMEHFDKLFWHVFHKYGMPTVLTGSPSKDGYITAAQEKRNWIRKILGPAVPVVVCKSKDKYLSCDPGDVLIDDWNRFQPHWEAVGGKFIHHTSVADSIVELDQYMMHYLPYA